MVNVHLDELQSKYQPVFDFMESQEVRLLNLDIEDSKLFIHAIAASPEIKNRILDQIRLIDPVYPDLIADIEVPGDGAAGGTTPARTYRVQPGDTIARISRQFYGDPSQYITIFKANIEKLTGPHKFRPGLVLVIP
jgi:nucleoid-associated protein YgaU